MKSLLFITLFLFTGLTFSQQFCAAPFKATDIAVSGSNVWMIGESDEKGKGIFYNKGNTWKFYGGMVGEKIYVGKNNRPIVINSQGLIYQFNGSNWQVLTGRASEIAVAKNNGIVWSVQGGNIYSYSNGQWIPFQGAQIASQHIDFDQAADIAHVYARVFDDEIAPLNQFGANLLGQKGVLEIRRIEHTWGQDTQCRVGLGAQGGEHLPEVAGVVVDRPYPATAEQLRHRAFHDLAVFDHVGHARRYA